VAVKPRRVALKIRLILAALEAASALTGALPRATVAEPVCRVAGALWYLSRPAHRAAVQDNLSHVLGRQPTRAEVVRVFHHGALNYWDTFGMTHVSRRELLELVDIQGAEHIDHALAGGRGAICVGAHLGSIAFSGQILTALGYIVVGLVERFEPVEVFEFFARQRQTLGSRLLPAGSGGLRELLQALRRNEVLGLVVDRDVTGTGPTIQFFGAPTQFPDGAAALSVHTGAPILIGIAVRKAGARFNAWIEPLPPVERTGDQKEDVIRLTQAIAGRLEYYVASYPEQWTVFQKRWPEGGRHDLDPDDARS
jgi:lauroyl/myristoyl acyltransferase